MQNAQDLFDQVIKILIQTYNTKNHNFFIHELIKALKIIYTNKTVFEEIMSRYYLDNRNPFTTAYQSFMIDLNGNYMNLGEVFHETATNLLYRLLKEHKTGNIYIVFD
jgi:hypothetical protein